MKFPDPTLKLKDQDPAVLLGITVFNEARGEGPLGQSAVAHVVCNRMRQKGQTVAEVALKWRQFSCFNPVKDGGARQEAIWTPQHVDKLGVWAGCLEAATEALAGASVDPTNGATHYCVQKLWRCPVVANKFGRRIPKWHDIQEVESGRTTWCTQIGTHVFAKAAW